MLRLLVLVCALTAITLAFENKAECGERPFKPNDKIVNGQVAAEFDWGWQALLLNLYTPFCGGVLINQDWVLTAAHCMARYTTNASLSSLVIALGIHDKVMLFSDNVQLLEVSALYRHPNFNSVTYANDIALLKLKTKAKFDKYVIPACLPAGNDTYENEKAYATGWGRLSYQGAQTQYKYQGLISVVPNLECDKKYPNLFDENTQLCTEKDGPCQGDSGGPLSHYDANSKKYFTIGLTSWGYDCGIGAVFTRVSGFRSWWENIVDNY